MNKYEKDIKELREELSLGFCEEDVILYTKLYQQLVERATLKKPTTMIDDDIHWLQCPVCSTDTQDSEGQWYNFCPYCGQALDWISD